MVWPFVFKLRHGGFLGRLVGSHCVMLHSTDGLLKLTFSTGILSCRRDQLRHFNSVNSSLTHVFQLTDFVDISYLTHLTIASLVTFAELCILLCYEVIALKFRKRVSIFVSFLSAILFVLAQLRWSCHSFLISPFFTQFHCFALNFTFLHWWNCTVH